LAAQPRSGPPAAPTREESPMSEAMDVRHRSRRAIAPVMALAVLAAFNSSPARADILPLLNASSVASTSTVQSMGGPLTDTKIDIAPPNPMQIWNGNAF